MSTQNDGGPAFPGNVDTRLVFSDVGGEIEPVGHKGMSLRDWFAGQALQGLMSNYELLKMLDEQAPKLPTRHVAAQHAYGFADAMLKERDHLMNKESKP